MLRMLVIGSALLVAAVSVDTASAQERPLVEAEAVYDKYSIPPEQVLANAYSTQGEVLEQVCSLDEIPPELMAQLQLRDDFEEIIAWMVENCPDVVATTSTVSSDDDDGDDTFQCPPGSNAPQCVKDEEDCADTNNNGKCDKDEDDDCEVGSTDPDCNGDGGHSNLPNGISFVMFTLADGTTVKIEGYDGDIKDPTDPERFIALIQDTFDSTVDGYVIKAGQYYYDETGTIVEPIPHQADYETTASAAEAGEFGFEGATTETTVTAVKTQSATKPSKKSAPEPSEKSSKGKSSKGKSGASSGGSSDDGSGSSSKGKSGSKSKGKSGSKSKGKSGGSSDGSSGGKSGSAKGRNR